MKDDLLLFAPCSLYPNILCDSTVTGSSCENPSLDDSTSDYSQNAQDFSPSFDCKEDKYFFPDPLDLSSFIYGNLEVENFCFSSTPLCDSLDHEDAIVHLESLGHGCHDLFTH